MDFKEIIQNDLIEAVKEKEELCSSVLRMLMAAITAMEKEKRYKVSQEDPKLSEDELEKTSQLSEEEIIEVVSYEAKKRREAIIGFEKGDRPESAAKERHELEILQKYLPKQLSEEEIRNLVKESIKETGAETIQDMGRVMKELAPKIKGKADGGAVSKVVRGLLNN